MTADDLGFNLGFDIGAGGIVGDTLGLVADGGSAQIDLGFYANLGDPAADQNGNGYLDVSEVPDSFQAEASGNATLDVPLGHKDAAYVRSHFDGIEVRLNDAPRANEIMVAVAVTDSGRPLPRVGGLTHEDAEGKDGLR